MTEQASGDPISKQVASKALASFVIAIGVMAFFGYVLGKDMALRDNAQEAAIKKAR